METENLKHWILSSPESLGGNVAGLRTPDAVAALVIDGFSTDDGQTFEFPPFEAGRQDAIFMVLPEEVGLKVFEWMEKYVAGRQSAKENLEDENEVIAARWSLGNEKLAILVGDSGGSEHIQEAFEARLAFEKIYLQRSELAVIAQGFDAAKVLSEDKAIFSSEAREALESLLVAPAPAPSRGKRMTG